MISEQPHTQFWCANTSIACTAVQCGHIEIRMRVTARAVNFSIMDNAGNKQTWFWIYNVLMYVMLCIQCGSIWKKKVFFRRKLFDEEEQLESVADKKDFVNLKGTPPLKWRRPFQNNESYWNIKVLFYLQPTLAVSKKNVARQPYLLSTLAITMYTGWGIQN